MLGRIFLATLEIKIQNSPPHPTQSLSPIQMMLLLIKTHPIRVWQIINFNGSRENKISTGIRWERHYSN